MQCRVELNNVTGTPLLVVRRRAALQDLPKVVPDACGVVWNFRGSQIASHGRNAAVYLNEQIDLEVGVEVGADVTTTSTGEVILSSTPAGMVATTSHVGPYAPASGWDGGQQRRHERPAVRRDRLKAPSRSTHRSGDSTG